LIKEKWGLQQNASDLVIIGCSWVGGSAISGDPSAHLLLVPRPILFSERLPNNTRWQNCEVAEQPATDDVIVWAMKFKEERFADLESAELLLPEARSGGIGN